VSTRQLQRLAAQHVSHSASQHGGACLKVVAASRKQREAGGWPAAIQHRSETCEVHPCFTWQVRACCSSRHTLLTVARTSDTQTPTSDLLHSHCRQCAGWDAPMCEQAAIQCASQHAARTCGGGPAAACR
jgi:hypothetical protein